MTADLSPAQAIAEALKAADEIAAALQAHLVEQHGADPDPDQPQNPAADSLRLLRQARQRLSRGLAATGTGHTADTDGISLRNS